MSGSDDRPRSRRGAGFLAPLQLLRLARGQPVSQRWGWDRGRPIDRHYIEQFLSEHRADIHGRVLEVKSSDYARRFGAQVEQVDVLDIDGENPDATIVADLASGDGIPDAAFDCFVLTQTLQYVYDVRAAVRHAARLLVQGGVLLATVPGISRVSTVRPGISPSDFWRFTPATCRELAAREFGDDHATVRAYGNALTSTAFVAGLAAEELAPAKLAEHDERFPLLIAFRAVKA
jgi:SAM-dependent methyltransferase